MNDIWQPITAGHMQLSHRLAMAPMTRSRAKPDGTPGDLAAEYYAQRASVGLLDLRRDAAFGGRAGLPRDARHPHATPT